MKKLGTQFLRFHIPRYFPEMQGILKEGVVGNAEIGFFEASLEDAIYTIQHPPFTPPGQYVQLLIDDKSVMTDTPYEQYTNVEACEKAHGEVLIAGLGLGMILTRIVPKRTVCAVTVIERNPNVVELVGPCLEQHFGNLWRKVSIIQDDAFNIHRCFSFKRKFDTIFADIQFPKGEVIRKRDEMSRLLRKYLKRGGWLGQWEGYEWEIRKLVEAGL